MPTYPNQRLVNIHRERATSDFLGIKNENWQAASRDLGAFALQLYLYLAANANNFTLALSPTAIRQDIGMARSTYHDQFNKLVDKGYLVNTCGNTYAFYEKPQPRTVTEGKNSLSTGGHDFQKNPSVDCPIDSADNDILQENIEINNMISPKDKDINIKTSSKEIVPKKSEFIF